MAHTGPLESLEIPIVFADKPDVIDSLKIEKTLSDSDGSFSVYEVYSPQSNTNYALKVFPKDPFGMEHYKKEQLISNLNHPNVIHYVPIINNNESFFALVTEYAEYGTFFEVLQNDLLNEEVLIRSYFHQLVEGLEYIHSQGVAHSDLKLENIMLGSDFLLKIIDFDQAQLITDKNVTSGGTIGFRAPEIRTNTATDPIAADIFSAGVILFSMLALELPFLDGDEDTGNPEDPDSYAFFVNNNSEFWRNKAEKYGNFSLFSQDFIELANGMLANDPKKRFSLEEVKNSKWYKELALNSECLKMAMKTKCMKLSQEH